MPKKMRKSGHDAGKDNEIRASYGEGSEQVPGKGRIQASAGKVEIRVSTREGSWRVSGKGRIQESAGKVESEQV